MFGSRSSGCQAPQPRAPDAPASGEVGEGDVDGVGSDSDREWGGAVCAGQRAVGAVTRVGEEHQSFGETVDDQERRDAGLAVVLVAIGDPVRTDSFGSMVGTPWRGSLDVMRGSRMSGTREAVFPA